MKVAVLHGCQDLRLDEVPRPAVGPGDLLIKVAAAGICGTDLHFRHMGPRFAGRPMPLGHEFAGDVVEIGSGVTRFQVGDRVAYNSNNSPADMGRGGECGGFSHYVVLREVDGHVQSLCRVPDNVSFDHAALVVYPGGRSDGEVSSADGCRHGQDPVSKGARPAAAAGEHDQGHDRHTGFRKRP